MTRHALYLLPLIALLTSCASPDRVVTVTEPVVLRSPEALRSCAPAPAVPGPGATAHAVAAYMLELHAAYRDCARTVAERNTWEDEAAGRL